MFNKDTMTWFENMLTNELRDKQIAVVGILGPKGGGKSALLNRIYRYVSSSTLSSSVSLLNNLYRKIRVSREIAKIHNKNKRFLKKLI